MSEYIVDMGDISAAPFSVLATFSKVSKHAAVREQIVRCKDCKLFRKLESGKGLCRRGSIISNDLDGNGFCSWGEPKDGES